MVGAGVFGEVNRAAKTSAFGVVCSIDHLANTRLNESTSAHRAGFQGHDQRALIQPPVAQNQRGLSQSHQFGMSKWI